MTISDHVKQVQDAVADACARAGRDPSEITLVAVSKRKPVSDVLAALAAGVQHFGENRVEEAQEKIPAVAARLEDLPHPVWHMVGHIQSRKVKDTLPLFSVIHSLDSVKLAEKTTRQAAEDDLKPEVFIQVNVSGEVQKYGFEGANWQQDSQVRDKLLMELAAIFALDRLTIRGLMTLAPYQAPEAELRMVFQSLAALKAELEKRFSITLPDLSMGMTDDYPIAIEEGATVIRVGRAIFGEREY